MHASFSSRWDSTPVAGSRVSTAAPPPPDQPDTWTRRPSGAIDIPSGLANPRPSAHPDEPPSLMHARAARLLGQRPGCGSRSNTPIAAALNAATYAVRPSGVTVVFHAPARLRAARAAALPSPVRARGHDGAPRLLACAAAGRSHAAQARASRRPIRCMPSRRVERREHSRRAPLGANELLVRDAVRAVGLGAEALVPVLLVGLEVALEPRRPASRPRTRARASRRGRGTSDRGRSRRRSPGTSSSASSSARSVSTSRSFVGSSSSRTLPPRRSSFARCTRLRSPPESTPTLRCWSEPLKLKPATYARDVDLALADLDVVVAVGDLLPDGLVGIERVARLVDVGELDGVAERERAAVGLLLADDHLEQRRLAGAVGADHADDPGGRQREGQVLDQQPVAEALAHVRGLDHLVAEARPGRDVDLDRVELDVALLGEQRARSCSGAPWPSCAGPWGSRAPTRAPAAIVRWRADSWRSSCASRCLLLLEPARVVALEREPVAAVELEDPARDVVEEVAIVGDRDDRALVLLQVALEPRRPTRRRGGSSARRAAAGRARRAAAGRARRGGARRRRAWTRRRRAAAGAARPSPGRAACRGSRRRRRRSGPAGARTRRRSRRSSSPRAR